MNGLWLLPLAFAAAKGPAGGYSSAGCGKRAYVRTYVLDTDGSFRADDLPHPCPGECAVQHVWMNKGKWTLSKDKMRVTFKITESYDSGKEKKASQPLPPYLDWTGEKLAEPTSADSKENCPLTRTP